MKNKKETKLKPITMWASHRQLATKQGCLTLVPDAGFYWDLIPVLVIPLTAECVEGMARKMARNSNGLLKLRGLGEGLALPYAISDLAAISIKAPKGARK